MSTRDKRLRTRPVYLTDTERDLVVSSLTVLLERLAPAATVDGSAINTFARSFTCKRIVALRAMFHDKATSAEAKP